MSEEWEVLERIYEILIEISQKLNRIYGKVDDILDEMP